MSDEQVQIAIDVLKAYVDGTLRTDLCDDLDEAIQRAFDVLANDWTSHDPEGADERGAAGLSPAGARRS